MILEKLSVLLISIFFLFSCSSEEYSISTNAYNTAAKAYKYAYSHGITDKKTYIYIDFTKPSTEKRLYVVQNGSIVYSTWVTHGIGSGNGVYVQKLSNVPNSRTSSIGVTKVVSYYIGKNGRSAKLQGLEQGFNNNVYARSIVIHSASYIGNGKTGTSWGCPAVSKEAIQTILSYATPNTLVITYYPQASWLSNSKFLH